MLQGRWPGAAHTVGKGDRGKEEVTFDSHANAAAIICEGRVGRGAVVAGHCRSQVEGERGVE